MKNTSLNLNPFQSIDELFNQLKIKGLAYLAPFADWDSDELTERMDSVNADEYDRLDEK